MKIFDQTRGRADTKPTQTGHVTVTKTGFYVNKGAFATMKLSPNKKIIFGTERRALNVGVMDKTDTRYRGFNLTLSKGKNSASSASPKGIREVYLPGRYVIVENKTDKNNITWYRLKRMK